MIGPAATVLHYAAEQGWCEYRRFRRFAEARRSTRQPASDETIAKLMNASTGHQRAFLAILYETGLRLADVMRLNDGMIDLSRAAILARVAKTKELIRIAISPSVVVMIANLERCRNGRLFPWPSRWSVLSMATVDLQSHRNHVYAASKPSCPGHRIAQTWGA